jgi:hypothetical protein
MSQFLPDSCPLFPQPGRTRHKPPKFQQIHKLSRSRPEFCRNAASKMAWVDNAASGRSDTAPQQTGESAFPFTKN